MACRLAIAKRVFCNIASNSARIGFICCPSNIDRIEFQSLSRTLAGVSVQAGIGRRKRGFGLRMLCLAVGAIWMSGCQDYNVPITSVNTGTSQGGTVTITPAGLIYVDVGRTRQMLVTITNDSANQGVTWSLVGPGSLSNITTTSATYTGSMNAGDTATINATGVANPTEIASASLYMVPLPTIPTVVLPTGTIGTTYSGIVTAVNGSAPFIWNVASGSLPPGINFSQTSLSAISIEGSPHVRAERLPLAPHKLIIRRHHATYPRLRRSYPAAIAKQSFSITTLNGTSSSSSANSSILQSLAGGGVNNSLVQGDYAFRFGGFNNQGMTAAAGSFSADGNGNILGGLADRSNVANGTQHGLSL